jgi:hypothetical protein
MDNLLKIVYLIYGILASIILFLLILEVFFDFINQWKDESFINKKKKNEK